MTRHFVTLSAALLTSTAAFAVESVSDIDMNNDDFASYEELSAVYQGLTTEEYERIDTNDDNRVSAVELYDSDAQDIVSLYEGDELPRAVIDMNGDGFSDYGELSSVFTGLTEIEFDEMDANDDNRLSQFEIYDIDSQVILNRYRAMGDVATISQADVDGDSFLSASELMSAYPGLTAVEFDEIDANDDNRVDFTELYDTEAQNIVSRYES